MSDSSPLSKDSKLKSLLNDVDSTKTVDEFNQWRSSFLELYTQYLDTKGSENADAAYVKFSKTSVGLKKVCKQLQGHIDKGDLTTERVSVRAKMSISELKAKLDDLSQEIDKLLPSTEKEIQSFGFSKWHMGAVLIRDGFKEYAIMMHCREILKLLRASALDDVADRQDLDMVDYFKRKFDIFCSVLADLGLMTACERATEILHAEMLEEARQAKEKARAVQREKLANSTHSSVVCKNKPLDMSRFAAFNDSSNKVDTNGLLETDEKVDDEESSYESIEETLTVSTYETIEVEDDSSYETVEEIEADSEYEETDEEIEVSEYETDTDDDSDNDQKVASGKKKSESRGKTKGKLKTKDKEAPKGASKKKKPSRASLTSDKDKGSGSPIKRSGGSEGRKMKKKEKEDESINEDDEEEEAEPEEESDSDSDLPPPKKYGKSKPMPEPHPDPNHDPYKPTERMTWKPKDYYYNGAKESPKPRVWEKLPLRKKKKDPQPEPEPEPPKEKKLRRVVFTRIIKRRRKLEKPPPKKIRVKKEKPPVKVQVRHEKKIVKRTRVKKDKKAKPIPKKIHVQMEKPKPSKPDAPPESAPERLSTEDDRTQSKRRGKKKGKKKDRKGRAEV